MDKQFIRCPCCNEKIKVWFDDSGNYSAVIFNEFKKASKEQLRQKGIELGVLEGEVND